jgi:hypothetical protein
MIASLPLAPSAPGGRGQATVVPISELLQPGGSWAFRYDVNRKVLPELSVRWTGTIAAPGSVTPGFRAAIAGSSHLPIFPLKIRASTVPSSLRCADALIPGTL